jgi:hypothetical protein
MMGSVHLGEVIARPSVQTGVLAVPRRNGDREGGLTQRQLKR